MKEHTAHTPLRLTHTDTHMAPTITAASSHSQEHLNHKLRKPLVEKLRRERINSSIEQLKSLLGPEFLKQQPDSKLEKADILEMTVGVLTRLQQQQQQQQQHFLSAEELKTQRRLMKHLHELQSDSDLSPLSSTVHSCSSKEQVDSALWRPW